MSFNVAANHHSTQHFFAPAVLGDSSQRHCFSLLCQSQSGLCTSMASPSKSLPLLCLTIFLNAFAKLSKTTLRSSFADLFSAIADRCATLHVNANANPLDSFPTRIHALPCQCQAMRCHYSSKPCRCSTQPRPSSAIQILAFADQHLSLPPLCASMPIEA